MSKGVQSVIVAIMAVVVAFLSGFYAGKSARITEVKYIGEKTIVRDTIVAERPVYVAKKVTDTIMVAVVDTVRLRDTIEVALPRETVTYRDSTYLARVSGYRPALDYIEVYQRTVSEVQRVEVTKSRNWAFGLQAGVGAVSGFREFRPELGYYIGIGITRSF